MSSQFDDVAELYDEARPGYPEETIEQIIRFAHLPSEGRVFEVGCGTGQMTRPLDQAQEEYRYLYPAPLKLTPSEIIPAPDLCDVHR